jgi:hypothetical protein
LAYAIKTTAVKRRFVPIPGVPIPSVPIPGVPIPGVPIPGVPIPGVPIPGVPIPGVPITGVPIPGVPIPGVPITGVPIPGVYNFKKFTPRNFTDNFKLVSTGLVTFTHHITICNHFCNFIFRVKTVIVETVSSFYTKMHTMITNAWIYVFFKLSRTFIPFIPTSPI